MKNLSKSTIEKREDLLVNLTNAHNDLAKNIEEFNEQVQQLFADLVEPALNDYNQAVTELNEHVADVANDLDEFFNSKSEKWQESEAGQNFSNWMESWKYRDDLDEVNVEEPEILEMPDNAVDGESLEFEDEIQ